MPIIGRPYNLDWNYTGALALADDLPGLLARDLLAVERGEAGPLLARAVGRVAEVDSQSYLHAIGDSPPDDEAVRTALLQCGYRLLDALLHPGQHDLPFGGVGASGMGHYHGYEGFATFSKLRPVFYQAGFSALKYLAPPYGKRANQMLDIILKRKL